jgi:replication-associated recombination protein RarA
MAQLFEKWRPTQWSEVVGQGKALESIDLIRARSGLAGRAWWINGKPGQGKTTIARLIAAEVADPIATIEVEAGELTKSVAHDWVVQSRIPSLYGGRGRAFIINEAHGLSRAVCDHFKQHFEPVSKSAVWIFTTTIEQQANLFDGDKDNQKQILGRCTEITLSQRDICLPYAERVRQIAQSEGLDGQPIEKYVRLMKECGNDMRRALSRIETGEMIGGGA